MPFKKTTGKRKASKNDHEPDKASPTAERRKSIQNMAAFLEGMSDGAVLGPDGSAPSTPSTPSSSFSRFTGNAKKKKEKPVSKDNIKIELAVVRGPHWAWGNDDGGPGKVGTILSFDRKTLTCTVIWHESKTVNAYYRYGKQKDLLVASEAVAKTVPKLEARGTMLLPKGGRRNSQATFSSASQTVIIFDWDDTLFPTTHIRDDLELRWQKPLDQQSLPAAQKAAIRDNLDKCAKEVTELLQLASGCGKVILVTLAKSPWVEESCKNFFPTIGGLIKELQVPVVYAQEGMTQVDYNKAAMKTNEDIEKYWSNIKGQAIAHEVKQFYTQYQGQSWKNIISIGDSDFERLGTQAATKDYMKKNGLSEAQEDVEVDGHVFKVRTKTFKLVDQPTIEELTVEVGMLVKWLPLMVRLDRGFDVNLNEVDNTETLKRIETVLSGSE